MINKIKNLFQESSFVIFILLLCIVPLIIIMYLTYSISETGLKHEMETTLNIIADEKVSAIDNFIINSQNEAKVLAHNSDIIDAIAAMDALGASPERDKKIDEIASIITPYISYLMSLRGYNSIYFLSPSKEVLFYLSKKNNYKIEHIKDSSTLPELSSIVDRAVILMETEVSNFTLSEGSEQQVAYIAVPIINQGDVIGVIVLELSSEEIFKILNASIRANATIESIVGIVQSDSQVQLTMPLKLDQNKKNLSSSNPQDKETLNYFVNYTKGAEQKSTILRDYRDHEVLAVSRYIPSLRWGLVTKIDTAEAFVSIDKLRKSIIWLAALSLPLLSFFLYEISKRLQSSKQLLVNIINSMPSQLVIFDENGKITLWNTEAQRLSNLSLEEAQKKPVTEIFKYLQPFEERIKTAITLHHREKFDRITYSAPEGNIYYDAVLYPLLLKDFWGSALIIQDITERIRLLEGLQQQDRLASIGLLVAGVAHEINNPVNFITANVNSLRNDVKDVLEVVKQYNKIDVNSITNVSALSNALSKIEDYKQEIGIDFTILEIDKLLNGMEEGAQRTASIVKGLKSFTRSDSVDMTRVDLIEGIESTLALLKNTYKHNVEIIREYETIPKVDCYPNKLNQVFMNILTNAIHAISEKGSIYIKTKAKSNNEVEISIRDTGVGIKSEHKSKIFMPFFTTKDVGKGTGLGLAISYNIIQDHHGTITVTSEENKGTEFVITLPIKQDVPLEPLTQNDIS